MNCENSSDKKAPEARAKEYETVRIEKPTRGCQLCEDYAASQAVKPVAVMCCEGGCLRGEIARQAANTLCYKLAPGKTARVCLGGAFTKDTGQRALVRNAPRVIAVEGCFLKCATRMMQGVLDGLQPEVVIADSLIDFNRNLFSPDEMPEAEIKKLGQSVAEQVAAILGDYRPATCSKEPCAACSS